MEVVLRCWQEILKPESHEYHKALGTTKPILECIFINLNGTFCWTDENNHPFCI